MGWYVANNLQNMWIVGSSGLILASADGGKTWEKQPSLTQEGLYGMYMTSELQYGWLVGSNGIVRITSNAGKTWEESSLIVNGKKVTEDLSYVNFFDDKHAVIGSGIGSVFTTDDGGTTWSKTGQVDDRGDWVRIYPSPAALAFSFFVLLLWVVAILTQLVSTPAILARVADGGVDDNPIEHPLDDRLGNLGIARALALLFLSKDTASPLAVAVCAPWGAGKSSLLRLLQRELRLNGARPVWFNAWHYREDTQLLAALMEHIRDQAKLSGWELGSLRFRAMLLWMRVLKKWLGVVLLLAIVFVALDKAWPPYGGGLLAEAKQALKIYPEFTNLKKLGESLPSWALPPSASKSSACFGGTWTTNSTEGFLLECASEKDKNKFPDIGLKIPENSPALSFLLEWQDKLPKTGLVLSLLTLVAVGYGLKKKTEPFTPAMLKAAKWLQTQTSVASMEKEAGFRYLFSREFTEVCTALGKGKLVLILDDLDRCDPSQIDKIMSTLNFLFSHAPCHAVLGMDWHYVRGAVGLAYEKLASEMAHGSKDDGRKQRAEFGEAFLEKIVQLRFNVPTQNSAAVVFRHSHLVDLHTPTPNIPWRNLPGRFASYGKQGKHAVGQAWRGLRQRSWAENWQHSIMRLRQLRRGAWYGWLALWHSTGDEIATAVARRDPGLFSRLLGFTLGCTVLFYVVAWGGREIKAYLHPEAVSTQTQAGAGDVTPGIKDKVIDEKPKVTDKDKLRDGGGDVEILLNPEANSASNVVWAFPSVALGLTLFWLVWAAAQIKDSAGFIQAVRFWSKSLHGKLSTPRAWRRFQNLARFYAMRLRVERQETQGWGRVWRQMRLHLGAWLRQRQVPGDTVEQDEGLLVSLLALGLLGHGKLLHSVCQQLSYPQLERDSVANLHECLHKCQRQCTPERQQALADLLAKITPTPAHLATKLVLPPSDWRNLQKLATEFAAFPALASFLTQLSATTHADLPYLPERVAAHLRTLVPEALPAELAAQLNALLNPPVLEQHPDRYASLQQILDFTLAGLVTVLGEMAEGEKDRKSI